MYNISRPSTYVDYQPRRESTVFEPWLVEFSDAKPWEWTADSIFIEKSLHKWIHTVQTCVAQSQLYYIVSPGLVYNPYILNTIFTVVYSFQNYEAFDFLVKFFNSFVFCVQEKI